MEEINEEYLDVALYTSAWIEIDLNGSTLVASIVALYTSAWIEMLRCDQYDCESAVALYTSAWIEMPGAKYAARLFGSHSTRVRGLKYYFLLDNKKLFPVALYTSAWIEIVMRC